MTVHKDSDYGAVSIRLKDDRCVNVDNDGHVTVWDADGEVEKELDV